MKRLVGKYLSKIAIPTTGKIPPETLRPLVNQVGMMCKIILTTSLPTIKRMKTGIARESPHEKVPQRAFLAAASGLFSRSEEHTSELQSRFDLVCRLLLD